MSVEQLTQLREQLENDLAEHRRGYGASRTREAAEQRIHSDFEAAESALAELIEKGRHAAITSTLTLVTRWGVRDLVASRQWRDMLLEAVARPASRGYADVLAPYSQAHWESRRDLLQKAIAEVDAEIDLRLAQAQLQAAEDRVKAAGTKEP
jgi:hypothetical protein